MGSGNDCAEQCVERSEIFSVKGADNSRYDVIVCLCLAGVAAVLAIAGAVYKFVRKKPQDR